MSKLPDFGPLPRAERESSLGDRHQIVSIKKSGRDRRVTPIMVLVAGSPPKAGAYDQKGKRVQVEPAGADG